MTWPIKIHQKWLFTNHNYYYQVKSTILTYNTYIFVKQVQVAPAGLELQGRPGSNDMVCISGENLDGRLTQKCTYLESSPYDLHISIC